MLLGFLNFQGRSQGVYSSGHTGFWQRALRNVCIANLSFHTINTIDVLRCQAGPTCLLPVIISGLRRSVWHNFRQGVLYVRSRCLCHSDFTISFLKKDVRIAVCSQLHIHSDSVTWFRHEKRDSVTLTTRNSCVNDLEPRLGLSNTQICF